MLEENGSKAKPQHKLNHRQLLFVQHYLKTFNATQALIQAGYKTKHPAKYSSELLAKPTIKSFLERTRLASERKNIVTFDWKVDKLRQIIEKESIASKNRMKAIEILNAMQGHNAATKHVNINANYVSTELDDARAKYLAVSHQAIELHKPSPPPEVIDQAIDQDNSDITQSELDTVNIDSQK